MAVGADSAPRTSAFARGSITGLAAARLGAARLGHKLRGKGSPQAQAEHEAALGRMLFQTLGQLRGTALKVAQLLSMDTTLLPPGIRQELAKACHQALPLNRALVGRVFRQALGAEPESLFAQFEPQAFAAASLGQVHRATLSGPDGAQPVAVKVQYPGIAATIASDMRLLRVSLQALGQGVLPLPAWPVVEQALQEIDATLRREVDYLHEAQELQWFATHAAMEGVHIPLPIASHTRTQVLTLQHLPGLHLHEWLATQPPQAVRNVAGQRLWDWFLHCAFQLGRIHADLHPGNVLFLPDGQIGLLDFGCTRRLSLPFRTEVRRAWSALLEPGTDACARTVFHAYQSLGLISANLKPTAFAQDALPLLAPMQAWQVEPFARMEAQSMFDFSRKTPPPQPTPAQQALIARYLADLPAEMPAFERAWMGLMHLLTQLGAHVYTRNPWITRANSTPHA